MREKSIRNGLNPQGKDALQVFWMAALLAICALAPAIFPYGGRMVTRGDFMEQQIPFIIETKRMLASGMPFWDWNTFLGTNFVGSYAFYTLGSPFAWLILPLPEAAIPYGISAMAVLKHAVAAVTAFLYLRRFVRDPRHAKVAALLYAFSSYSIINTQFYHFMDVVAVFPLLLLALENAFVGKRRYGALALACGLNAMVNYYFFAGSALFVAIYTAFRFFSQDWRENRRFWRLFSVVFECGLGCLLAAWILMPAGWAMMSVSRSGALKTRDFFGLFTWSNSLERLRAIWMPIESGVVHGFYGDGSSWSSVAAFLPLFGCALALWHAMARPKRWIHALLLTLVLISLWPLANRLFTLGSNLTYTRWWYALVLMLCIPTGQALEALPEREHGDLRRMNLVLGITAVVSLLFVLPALLPSDFLRTMGASSFSPVAWLGRAFLANRAFPDYGQDAFRVLGVALAALNLLGLWLVTRKRILGNARVLYAALTVAIVANYAGFIAVNDALVPLGDRAKYPTGVDYYAQHLLLEEKPSFTGTTYTHRVDAPPKLRNYGMQINQPSITSFHSLRSSYLDEFMIISGFGYYESPDAVPSNLVDGAIRTLLGVKYYYNYDEAHYPGAPEGFVRTGQVGSVTVYENPRALPLGFAYDCYATQWDSPVTFDYLSEIMAQGVVLRREDAEELKDVLEPLWERPMIDWRKAVLERGAQACYDVEMTPGGLTAKIDLERERFVFFSVQYDKGWSAKVDGEPVKLYNANLGMLGLRVPAGQGSEIVLTYRPRGLREGAAASVLGVLVLVGYCLLMRRMERERRT